MWVKKQQLELDMEQLIGSKPVKEYEKAVYCQPSYLCRVHHARLDESQTGIKIPGRNINNLRYADDITLMAESEEELNSFLIRVKEKSGKAGLKLSLQKN